MWFDNAKMRPRPPTVPAPLVSATTPGRHTVLISPHRCTNTLTVYTRDPADWPRWVVKQITKPLASLLRGAIISTWESFSGIFQIADVGKEQNVRVAKSFWRMEFARVTEHVMCSTGFFMVSNALSFNKGMFHSLYRMFSLEARRRKFRETLFQESSG